MMEEDQIWYFAYGSNMNPKTLTGRRGVKPSQSKPSFAPGYYLNFDSLGIPYIEPSFASIGPKPILPSQPEVQGVVHQISLNCYAQIRRTERGSGHENIGYSSVQITIKTYDGETLQAYTLVEVEKAEDAYNGQFYPSKRYMDLIEGGAEAFGLKQEYQKWLKSIPRYVPLASLRHRAGRIIFLSLVVILYLPILIAIFGTRFVGYRPPRFVYVVSTLALKILGNIYYFVFLPLFGPGAGEPIPLKKKRLS